MPISLRERLERALFWDRQYNRWWNYAGDSHLSSIKSEIMKSIPWYEQKEWEQATEGCKEYWRKFGRRSGYSPEYSAFRGMQDLADRYYKQFLNSAISDQDRLIRIAILLAAASTSRDESDNFVGYAGNLSNFWKAIHSQVK